MTDVQQLFDPFNQFIGPQPANITFGQARSEQGQLLVVTIRSAATTLTLMLSPEDAKTWARLWNEQAAKLTGLAVAAKPLLDAATVFRTKG